MPITISSPTEARYRIDNTGLSQLKRDKGGNTIVTPLANFGALITEEIYKDNGQSEEKALIVSGTKNGQELPEIELSFEQFEALRWPALHWGTGCLVEPLYNAKQKLSHGIQWLSNQAGDVPVSRVYTHSGWRSIGKQYTYLHSGRNDKTAGVNEGTTTSLDSLADFCHLPTTRIHSKLDAATASYDCLDCSPFPVAVALLGCAYLSPFSEALQVDFMLWVEAPSRSHKSSYTGLINAHFGHRIDYHRLACNWTDTPTAIEHCLFTLADTMVTIDDFAPKESRNEQDKLEASVNRVVRLVGNRASRGRGTASGGLQQGKPCRAMVVATGEQYPKGESINSRLFGVTLGKGQINTAQLSDLQEQAGRGLLSQSMADFIHDLAANFTEHCQSLKSQWLQWRKEAAASGLDGRLPDQVAFIYLGFNQAINHWQKAGVIGEGQAKALAANAWQALLGSAREHSRRIHKAQPVDDFANSLTALLQSGRCHLCCRTTGNEPQRAGNLLGWSNREPEGRRLGWVDTTKNRLYLLPQAIKEEYAESMRRSGTPLTIGWPALFRQMQGRGILEETNDNKNKYDKPVKIEGTTKRVLVIDAVKIGLLTYDAGV